MYQVFTTEQKVSVGLRLLKIRLALRAHKRFSTLMLAPIDFLSCSGFLEKLAEGQFFTRAWAAEKINRNSARLYIIFNNAKLINNDSVNLMSLVTLVFLSWWLCKINRFSDHQIFNQASVDQLTKAPVQ